MIWLAMGSACIESSDRLLDVADASGEVADSAEVCAEPGITRCAADAVASEICLDGRWQRAACAAGKICVQAGGAQCVDSTGNEDCRDTLYCFLGCAVLHADNAVAADSCFVECFRTATQPAQRELSDVTSCFEDNCEAATGLDCAAQRCSQDLADCYYDTTGSAGCARIIECRVACGDDEACDKACGSDSSIDAQGRYAVLELCIFYACAGQDGDCARRAALPIGACGAYTSACVAVGGEP